jgi:hypothetical protein
MLEVLDLNRRTAGVVFCGIAAFLFAAKYLCAAIYGSGMITWNSELFGNLLTYVGSGLMVTSVISLIVGIIYLLIAEIKKQQ